MSLKQEEMDHVVSKIYTSINEQNHLSSTLFVLAGDHGMNEKGNHGGCTSGETAAALLFASPHFGPMEFPLVQSSAHFEGGEYMYHDLVHQADLVPTLSGLLGLSTPSKNVGVFIPAFLKLWPEGARLNLLRLNEAQLKSLFEMHSRERKQDIPASRPRNNTGTDDADTQTLIEVSLSICNSKKTQAMILDR